MRFLRKLTQPTTNPKHFSSPRLYPHGWRTQLRSTARIWNKSISSGPLSIKVQLLYNIKLSSVRTMNDLQRWKMSCRSVLLFQLLTTVYKTYILDHFREWKINYLFPYYKIRRGHFYSLLFRSEQDLTTCYHLISETHSLWEAQWALLDFFIFLVWWTWSLFS